MSKRLSDLKAWLQSKAAGPKEKAVSLEQITDG